MSTSTITALHNLSDLSRTVENAKGKLVVIDFNATWCGPCHAIAPRYQAFSKKYTNVVFTEVDVDKAQDVARKFGVSAMPTFIFLKNGAQVDSVRGANPQGLEAAIQKHSTGGAAAGSSAFSGKGQTLSGSNVSKEAAGPSPVDFSAITNMDPQVQILLALVGIYAGYVLFFS